MLKHDPLKMDTRWIRWLTANYTRFDVIAYSSGELKVVLASECQTTSGLAGSLGLRDY